MQESSPTPQTQSSSTFSRTTSGGTSSEYHGRKKSVRTAIAAHAMPKSSSRLIREKSTNAEPYPTE